jgi:hypothetical protein
MSSLNVIADAKFTALSDARSALAFHVAIMGQKRATRDADETALRVRLRGAIDELTQLLENDDPLFYAFGINPPDASETPEQPENLVLTPGAPGTIYADWDNAPRADYYRVYRKVVGVDPDFTLDQSPADSDATLTGLPSGQTVQLHVIAVNEAGNSPASSTEEIVVP